MSIVEERLAILDGLVLYSGAHEPDGKFCVMEATAYIAGEPWSDHPKCVSPVIATFLRAWNDGLPDDQRQMLAPYVTKPVGTTRTKRDEEKRAWMCTDWLARECAPAFLRCAGLTEHAEFLEALASLTTSVRAREAQPTLVAARDAARAAAWDAAGDAARAAAGDALAPTVTLLQTSALGLLDRMIEVGK